MADAKTEYVSVIQAILDQTVKQEMRVTEFTACMGSALTDVVNASLDIPATSVK